MKNELKEAEEAIRIIRTLRVILPFVLTIMLVALFQTLGVLPGDWLRLGLSASFILFSLVGLVAYIVFKPEPQKQTFKLENYEYTNTGELEQKRIADPQEDYTEHYGELPESTENEGCNTPPESNHEYVDRKIKRSYSLN